MFLLFVFSFNMLLLLFPTPVKLNFNAVPWVVLNLPYHQKWTVGIHKMVTFAGGRGCVLKIVSLKLFSKV